MGHYRISESLTYMYILTQSASVWILFRNTVSYLSTLCLSFLICKLEMIIVPLMRIYCINSYKRDLEQCLIICQNAEERKYNAKNTQSSHSFQLFYGNGNIISRSLDYPDTHFLVFLPGSLTFRLSLFCLSLFGVPFKPLYIFANLGQMAYV